MKKKVKFIAALIFFITVSSYANIGKYCNEDKTTCLDLKANNKLDLEATFDSTKKANMYGSYTVNCDVFNFVIERLDEKDKKPLLEYTTASKIEGFEYRIETANAVKKLCRQRYGQEKCNQDKEFREADSLANILKKEINDIKNTNMAEQDEKTVINEFQKQFGTSGHIFRNSIHLGKDILTKAGLKPDFPKQYYCSNGELKEKETFEKFAVYVSGASDAGINKSFRNNLIATTVQSGKYVEIGDTETFYKELEKNREDGIGQITETAKKYGADIVCLVSMTEAFGEYSISARTIKTSDSQIIKTVSLNRSLKSLDDLTMASNELVKQLFQPQPAATGSNASLFNPFALAQPNAVDASTEMHKEIAQNFGDCYEEFADAPKKLDNFDIPSYIANLAVVKGKCSVPVLGGFLCSPESVGLSAKCVKELPTDLSELQKSIIRIAPVMIKGFIAKQLDISKDRVPSDVSQLKNFAIEIGTEKAAEVLNINPSEIPKNIKGMESFIYNKVENKASEALGVENSAIPKDKAQLSPFIQEQAKKKIASKLGMKADEIKLSASALKGYAEKDESLAPVAGLVQAANIWGTLNLVSTACPLLKCPADDTNISDVGAIFTSQSNYDDAQTISTNIPQKENNASFNKSTIIGIAMAVAGAGLAAYGFLCEKNAVLWYENDYQNQTGQQARDTWQSIQDAQKIRNMSYGAGGALFLSGLGVTIFF